MNANGLRDGQEWAIAPGGAWQARLCRAGRAHVIGRELAKDSQHGPRYAEFGRNDHNMATGEGLAGFHFIRSRDDDGRERWVRRWFTRRWRIGAVGFDRAHRVAAFHELMVIAAKRQEVV
jgi:hypothetical protein